jgi:hypothetical protein
MPPVARAAWRGKSPPLALTPAEGIHVALPSRCVDERTLICHGTRYEQGLDIAEAVTVRWSSTRRPGPQRDDQTNRSS